MGELGIAGFGFAVVGKGNDGDAAAGIEGAEHLQIAGSHELDEVVEDHVDAILVEIALIPEAEEIELERFALDHPLIRDVTDRDRGKIGLSGHGAEGGELRTIKGDPVVAPRVLVGKGFQKAGIVGVGVGGLFVSQLGNALKLFFVACHRGPLLLCDVKMLLKRAVRARDSR